MFLLIPRLVILVLSVLGAWFFVKIFLFRHDETKPLLGCRKATINFVYGVFARILGLFSLFTWHSYRYLSEADVDYTEYLGSNTK